MVLLGPLGSCTVRDRNGESKQGGLVYFLGAPFYLTVPLAISAVPDSIQLG